MALADDYASNPEKFGEKRVEQLIKFAGEGKLIDDSKASIEFRNLLYHDESILHRMGSYEECSRLVYRRGSNSRSFAPPAGSRRTDLFHLPLEFSRLREFQGKSRIDYSSGFGIVIHRLEILAILEISGSYFHSRLDAEQSR